MRSIFSRFFIFTFFCFHFGFGQRFVPLSESVDSFQENTTLGMGSPLIAKTSASLKKNTAYAPFFSMDDFSFGYRLRNLPDTFTGELTFNKSITKEISTFGHFDLLTVGEIGRVSADAELIGLSGIQSYALRPGIAYRVPFDMAVSTDMEFLVVDILDEKNFSYNLSFGYAKVWPKLGLFSDTTVGVYAKNVFSALWVYSSPFSLAINASTTMWKGYFSFSSGFRYAPQLPGIDAYHLDFSVSSFFLDLIRVNLGYLNILSSSREFNMGLSFLYGNFQISYALNNITQNTLIYSSGPLGFEHIFSLNVFYKGVKITSSKRKLKSIGQINNLLKLGEEQFKVENYKEARNTYEKILILDRKNVQAISRIKEIEKTIEAAIDNYNKEGKEAFRNKHYVDALGHFKKSILLDENNLTANKHLKVIKAKIKDDKQKHYALAQLHLKSKNYPQALKNAEAMLLTDPQDRKAIKLKEEITEKIESSTREGQKREKGYELLAAGDRAIQEGDFKKARQIYVEAKTLGLDSITLRPYLKKLQFQEKSKQKIEEASAYYAQANEAFNQKNIEKGIDFLVKTMKAYPEHEEAKQALVKYKSQKKEIVKKALEKGMQAFQSKDYVLALEHWSTAKAVDQNNSKIHQYLNMLNSTTERFFKSALKKGKAYLKSEEYLEAKEQFSIAYKFRAENEEVVDLLMETEIKLAQKYDQKRSQAIALYEEGKHTEAKELFLAIKKDLKSDEVADFYLAEIDKKMSSDNAYAELSTLFANRNFKKAKEVAQNLQKIAPDYPGLNEKIKQIEEKLLEENRDNFFAVKFQEGVTAFKQKQFVEAIAKWQEIKNLDPQNELVSDYIEKAKKRQAFESDKDFSQGQQAYDNKDWLSARTHLRKAIASNPGNEKAKALLVEVGFELEKIQKEEEKNAARLFEVGNYAQAKKKYALLMSIDEKNAHYGEMTFRIEIIEELQLKSDEAEKKNNPLEALIAHQGILEINSADNVSLKKIEVLSRRINEMKGDLLNDAENYFNNRNYKKAIDNWQALISANLVQGSQKATITSKIEEASKLRKKRIDALKKQAQNAFSKGVYATALKLYNKAIGYDPNNIALRKNVQEVKQKISEENKRKAKAKRISTIVLMDKGLAQYKAGNNREAIKFFQQILATNPNDQQAREFLNRSKTKLLLQEN